MKTITLTLLACAGLAFTAAAQDARPKQSVLITNAKIFNGTSEKLIDGTSVLVDAKGRTLMPGFIDAHVHLMAQVDYRELLTVDESYFALFGAHEARKMLLRGFTTARDAAGNTFSLKRAIDQGMMIGPRIYPTGAIISQTGGHADYRPGNAVPRPHATELQPMERAGSMVLVDGEAEMLTAVREQLRRGAPQIKIANRYQWDAVLSDGDMYKAGVGGQGVYISPANDMVVAWFCTSDGNNQEEAMARAIVKSLSKK